MEIYNKRYCRVDFEPSKNGDRESTNVIHRAIDTIEEQLNLNNTEIYYGSPACGPYVVFESDSLQAVTRAGEMLEKVLAALGYSIT